MTFLLPPGIKGLLLVLTTNIALMSKGGTENRLYQTHLVSILSHNIATVTKDSW